MSPLSRDHSHEAVAEPFILVDRSSSSFLLEVVVVVVVVVVDSVTVRSRKHPIKLRSNYNP